MSHPLAAALRSLAVTLHRDWQAVDNDDDAFADLAAEALQRARLGERFDIAEWVAELAAGRFEPATYPGGHGSPGIIPVFDGAGFLLFLHAWYDDIANCHSHAWSGAYQVLRGTSVAARATFEAELAADPRFLLGHLDVQPPEILAPGAIVAVPRGRDFIHGLAYADHPGFAISIRTRSGLGDLTYDFWSPGLAVRTGAVEDPLAKQLRSLDALHALDPERCAAVLRATVGELDRRSAFLVLRHVATKSGWAVTAEELLSHTTRFGRYRDHVRDGLADSARHRALEAVRARLRDVEHRFLLCGLQLATTRPRLEALVRARHPGEDPAAWLESRLVELLSTAGGAGQSLLGTPLADELPLLLPLMLRDDRPEAILAGLEAHYEVEDIRAKAAVLLAACAALRRLPVLRPLWRA